jgi:hypothetical protein
MSYTPSIEAVVKEITYFVVGYKFVRRSIKLGSKVKSIKEKDRVGVGAQI